MTKNIEQEASTVVIAKEPELRLGTCPQLMMSYGDEHYVTLVPTMTPKDSTVKGLTVSKYLDGKRTLPEMFRVYQDGTYAVVYGEVSKEDALEIVNDVLDSIDKIETPDLKHYGVATTLREVEQELKDYEGILLSFVNNTRE
jgi:(2Fe-2S) ferredoxin